MQEEINTARASRQSSFNEISNLVSDDLHIDSRFAAGSPIIGLILNNDAHQRNRRSPLHFDNDEDDEDFEFEFPMLLSNAEQTQTVRCAAKRSGSSSRSCSNGSGGSRSIRGWGVSIREMLNRREKKASWFVRLGSSKKTVEEGAEKRRGNHINTSSYRIVGFGLFYRM